MLSTLFAEIRNTTLSSCMSEAYVTEPIVHNDIRYMVLYVISFDHSSSRNNAGIRMFVKCDVELSQLNHDVLVNLEHVQCIMCAVLWSYVHGGKLHERVRHGARSLRSEVDVQPVPSARRPPVLCLDTWGMRIVQFLQLYVKHIGDWSVNLAAKRANCTDRWQTALTSVIFPRFARMPSNVDARGYA